MVDLFTGLGALAILALLARLLLNKLSILRKAHIPASVLGGLLGILLVQTLSWTPYIERTQSIVSEVRALPGILINFVFASLMLGNHRITLKKSLEISKPNILMGHAFAWGQHWVGALLVILAFGFFYEDANFLAPLIAIGFQGGHGTAAGLAKTYKALGFEAGVDLGLGVATGGVLVGLISGIALFSFLRRHASKAAWNSSKSQKKESENESSKGQESKTTTQIISDLTIQLGFLCLTILIAWALFRVGEVLEGQLLSKDEKGLLRYIPLFPIVLLTSILLNHAFRSLNLFKYLRKKTIDQLGSTALDFLILAAITTLNLQVLSEYAYVILAFVVCGVLWNVLVFWFLGRMIYAQPWFVYGLTDYGGATATTATGLLLSDIADPERETDARRAYVFKQPFYEPFMGGGLVTALALPLVQFGGIWLYFASTTLVLGLIVFLIFRERKKRP